ncbi:MULTISPECIES: Panacea domain-containing protein [unclassified Corynebacterium]|uniref:Panacea domain-containing protein n=1 Tax=Corynebacterium TaxID=1716 RepID=UPI002551B6C5|nr:Panacea domain-containing protein [Corynebacterium sp. MSK072]MDK8831232.1 Panacea domain-containing protein [Corynebacterium sp. MSK072]
MAEIFDVGQYITERIPNVDKLKLYKLCYFSQGWHLAWTGRPLFQAEFQAWRHGPVSRELHIQTWQVAGAENPWPVPYVPGGQSDNLSTYEREVVDSIIAFYGGVESTRLPDLSHGLAWNEILQEFSQAMISGAPTPRPPLQPAEVLLPNVDLDGDVDEHLASPQAKEIEQDWWETFRILADR